MEEMHLRPVFHRYAVFLGGAIAVILAFAGLASLFFPAISPPALAIGGLLAVVLLARILQRYYLHTSTEYVIDDNEITEVTGFWAKDEKHVPISKIEDYTINRTMFGKLLGVANIGIQTARAESGNEIVLRAIRENDAETLDKLLDAQVGSGKKK